MTPTHTQGRLSAGEGIHNEPLVIGYHGAHPIMVAKFERMDDADESVRRWNAFEEGGAVLALAEALRRYMLDTEEVGGTEQLCAEFGGPSSPDSSWSEEEWRDRVLRNPARAALAALTDDGGGR